MNILNHDGTVTSSEIFRLQLWFEKLLAEDFDKWIRDFHLIEWTEKLSDLSFPDLSLGFKNFQSYRNMILDSSVLPFPICVNKFKEFCYGLNMSSSYIDKCGKSIIFESLDKIANKDFSWRHESDNHCCSCESCKVFDASKTFEKR